MSRVSVAVQPEGGRPYDVILGPGVRGELAVVLGSRTRVAVVHTASVGAVAHQVSAHLADAGSDVLDVEVPEGEQAKSGTVAELCWARLGAAGFTRDDAVVGVGGGAVTDLAGFVAATWLRGIDVVHLPTTLLAMVDAAVGGKTAINTSAGKNLVGAFHHPRAVLCDTDTLKTLPTAELVSGMAEVVKAGFIADPTILDLIEMDPDKALVVGPTLDTLIERAIRVKADVVSLDPSEKGRREILNYGHTFGHAIERAEGFSRRHGEAVSIGMCFVAELADVLGRLDGATVRRHSSILASLGLPTSYPGGHWEELAEGMRVDKKNRGTHRRFIVLNALATPVVLDDPTEESLLEAYERVSR